jgi:Lar family restriction alleviation protein
MQNELKPCPFCGGKVKRIIGYKGLNFFKCIKCGAVMSFDNDYYNTHKNEAIEAYNRRVCNAE